MTPPRSLNLLGTLLRASILTVASAALAACGGDVVRTGDPITSASPSGTAPTAIMQTLWRPAVRRVVIEVDYGPNAAPYVGSVPGMGDAWSILRANAQRLFRGSGKTVTVPVTLGQMQRIDVSGRDFTSEDLVALSRRTRNQLPTGDTATFHVLVLDGWFRDASGQRRTDLLGGHLEGTGVIVVFKPVVASTASREAPYAAAVVEQLTLVHELGHAVGLVDDGVAPARAHGDNAHPHHCTNAACVMNAWNEGTSAATSFVARVMRTGDPVLFDDDCLADAAAALAAAR